MLACFACLLACLLACSLVSLVCVLACFACSFACVACLRLFDSHLFPGNGLSWLEGLVGMKGEDAGHPRAEGGCQSTVLETCEMD